MEGAVRPERADAARNRERVLAAARRLSAEHRDLLLEVDHARPAGRYRTGAYAAWATHTALLLRELRPDAEAALLADVLLAPLSADLVEHVRADAGRSLDD